MLSARTGAILKFIVGKYIEQAVAVSSQLIANNSEIGVSPATIRNEMAYLEQEGYIIRPHTSAGSIPSDKGYRYYVESLGNINLPQTEQHLVSHLFHQVEKEVEKWLGLTATLLAQLAKNVALVTVPKPLDGKFKNMELVALRDSLALLVLVFHGAKIKQKLITLEQIMPQPSLTTIANKLNAAYSGLNRRQILAQNIELSLIEQQIKKHLVEMMQAEDELEYEEPYLDGWHLMLKQPEFAHSHRIRALMELVEQRNLLKTLLPKELSHSLRVIIGKENEAEAFHDYSVVITHYGIPDEVSGTVGVIGPTRMPYAHTIPSVSYLASVLSELVAGLYGKEISVGVNHICQLISNKRELNRGKTTPIYELPPAKGQRIALSKTKTRIHK